MINERQRRLFELTVLHGCSQAEAGKMLDPPISQPAVHLQLKELYDISPELKAITNFLKPTEDNQAKSPIPYTSEMDNHVKQTF